MKIEYPAGWERENNALREEGIRARMAPMADIHCDKHQTYDPSCSACRVRYADEHSTARVRYDALRSAWVATIMSRPPMTLEEYYTAMESAVPGYTRPVKSRRGPSKASLDIAALKAENTHLREQIETLKENPCHS